MSDFLAFLSAIPELYKLVQILEQAAKEAQIERKSSQAVKDIHTAFASGDPMALQRVFQPPKSF